MIPYTPVFISDYIRDGNYGSLQELLQVTIQNSSSHGEYFPDYFLSLHEINFCSIIVYAVSGIPQSVKLGIVEIGYYCF